MGNTTDFFDITTRNWRARLAVSVELMRELSRYTDPEELYTVFSRRMTQLYPTARQLTISRRGLDRPEYRVTRFNMWANTPNDWHEEDRNRVRRGGLLADLLYEDQPFVLDVLKLDPDDPCAHFFEGQQSLLAIPLFDHGTAQNMVIVTREAPAAFPREQVPELVWLSNLFARATQTLVLSDRLQELYDAADYELRAIGELQTSLLPEHLPHIPGLDVGVHYQTANRAGGDYYDFFPLPGGKLAVLIADVSGHGTPAAVLMAITHSLAHALPHPPTRAGDFLAYLNKHLAKHYTLSTGNFVTAVCVIFDPVNGTATISNAGHTPPRVRRNLRDDRYTAVDQVRRLPLGVTHRTQGPYPETTIEFKPGAELVLFTDGIVEPENRYGEPFGIERLDAALLQPANEAREGVDHLVEALRTFTGRSSGEDDRTLVVVRRNDLAAKRPEKSKAGSAEL